MLRKSALKCSIVFHHFTSNTESRPSLQAGLCWVPVRYVRFEPQSQYEHLHSSWRNAQYCRLCCGKSRIQSDYKDTIVNVQRYHSAVLPTTGRAYTSRAARIMGGKAFSTHTFAKGRQVEKFYWNKS